MAEGPLPQHEVQAYGIRDFSRIYAVSESTTRRLIKADTIDTVLLLRSRLVSKIQAKEKTPGCQQNCWYSSCLPELPGRSRNQCGAA